MFSVWELSTCTFTWKLICRLSSFLMKSCDGWQKVARWSSKYYFHSTDSHCYTYLYYNSIHKTQKSCRRNFPDKFLRFWTLKSVITFLQLRGIFSVTNNIWPAATMADYELVLDSYPNNKSWGLETYTWILMSCHINVPVQPPPCIRQIQFILHYTAINRDQEFCFLSLIGYAVNLASIH